MFPFLKLLRIWAYDDACCILSRHVECNQFKSSFRQAYELSVNLRSGIFVWIGACAIFLVIALLVLTFGRELLTELAKPIIVQRYGSSADEKIKELPAPL